MQAVHRQTFLLSFSMDGGKLPSERGYGRARMWEQYAERRAGVCLCFDREKLVNAARTHLVEVEAGPVTYRPGGFAMSPARLVPHFDLWPLMKGVCAAESLGDESIIAELREEIVGSLNHLAFLFPESEKASLHDLVRAVVAEGWQQYFTKFIREFFLLKDADWATEQEYRIARTHFGAPVDYMYLPLEDSLLGVILGDHCPEQRLPGAVAACRGLGADVLRLDWSSGWPEPIPIVPSDEVR
jgi:hypothetical protein